MSRMSGIIGSEIQKNRGYLDLISSQTTIQRGRGSPWTSSCQPWRSSQPLLLSRAGLLCNAVLLVPHILKFLFFYSIYTITSDHSTHHFHLRKSISPAPTRRAFLTPKLFHQTIHQTFHKSLIKNCPPG